MAQAAKLSWLRRVMVLLLYAFMSVMLLNVTGCGKDEDSPKPDDVTPVKVGTPFFNPEGGSYTTDQSVVVATETEGAVIFYTLDGTDPTHRDSIYTAPIPVQGNGLSMTIKAVAHKENMLESEVGEATYLIEYPQVGTPVFSPKPGVWNEDIVVKLSTVTAGAVIHYTTDGTLPDPGSDEDTSTVYDDKDGIPVEGDGTTITVKAIGVKEGMLSSNTAEGKYQISLEPEPPLVTEPAEGAVVGAAFAVSGTAVPGNQVSAVLLDVDEHVIGSDTGEVDEEGAFTMMIKYQSGVNGVPMVLKVTQTNGEIHSEAVVINLVQEILYEVSGEVVGGSAALNGGAPLIIWLLPEGLNGEGTGEEGTMGAYQSSAQSVVEPLDTIVFAPDSYADDEPVPFSFMVEEGNYVIRAFNDNASGNTMSPGEPDGLPTMGVDPQTLPVEVAVDGSDVNGIEMTMEGTWSHQGFVHGLQAFFSNDSSDREPPYYFDEDEGDWMAGEGLCGGFYLRLQVHTSGVDTLSDLRVRTPDGTVVTLLDDGGCGHEVHDNTGSSYDHMVDDGEYTYGLPDPGDEALGDYLFFYEVSEGFIHIESMTIDQILKLERGVHLTSPTGGQANTSLTPELKWDPVDGVDMYHVYMRNGIRNLEYHYDHYDEVDEAVWQIPAHKELEDGQSYCVHISPVMKDDDGAVVARANGTESCFTTCLTPDSCITVSGEIINESGVSGDYLLLAGNDEAEYATLYLSGDATSYELVVPASIDPDADDLSVELIIDVDGSGDRNSQANQQFRKQVRHLERDQDHDDVDMIFRPMPRTISPASDASGVGNQPEFQWEPFDQIYEDATGTPLSITWAYAVYAQRLDDSGDFPQMVWSLDSSITSFNMADPPDDRFDVAKAVGLEFGQDFESVESLESADQWVWGIVIFGCEWNDFPCIMDELGDDNNFAMSPQVLFSTN